MHFQFKNSFSHQIVRCAKGKVALKKNAFLELFLRIIEDEKWNLFEKLGQLRNPNLHHSTFHRSGENKELYRKYVTFRTACPLSILYHADEIIIKIL